MNDKFTTVARVLEFNTLDMRVLLEYCLDPLLTLSQIVRKPSFKPPVSTFNPLVSLVYRTSLSLLLANITMQARARVLRTLTKNQKCVVSTNRCDRSCLLFVLWGSY